MSNHPSVIVIGSGPSGMIAAITAARQGASVTVLDHMKTPGRKLLLTGNGRCNLTNMDPFLQDRYGSSDPVSLKKLTASVFSQCDAGMTRSFFREIGLPTVEKDGLVYPACGHASAVLQVLLLEMKRLGVRTKYDCNVRGILFDKKTRLCTVLVSGWQYTADRVILCCGSCAAPMTGSDGSGYALARGLGHTVVPPAAALTALETSEKWLASCAGTRTQAKVSLRPEYYHPAKAGNGGASSMEAADGYTESGELQWTDHELSGIAVFQLSRYAARPLMEGKKAKLIVDLFPDLSEDELAEYLCSLKNRQISSVREEELYAGLLPEKLLKALLRLTPAALPESSAAAKSRRQGEKEGGDRQIQESRERVLAKAWKAVTLPVTGTRAFEQAQVCCGGVSLSEIDPRTLSSRLHSQLAFAGELLDVDGPCGGYNLQWCWSSGFVAGRHIAGE